MLVFNVAEWILNILILGLAAGIWIFVLFAGLLFTTILSDLIRKLI